MTDTVAVALIAVAGTLGSGLLGYLASQRSADVQLASVRGEMQQLIRAQTEEARQVRVELYSEFLATVWSVEQVQRALVEPTGEAFADRVSELMRQRSRINLLSSENVVFNLDKFMEVIVSYSEKVIELAGEMPEATLEERLKKAADETSARWHTWLKNAQDAMREDIELPPSAT